MGDLASILADVRSLANRGAHHAIVARYGALDDTPEEETWNSTELLFEIGRAFGMLGNEEKVERYLLRCAERAAPARPQRPGAGAVSPLARAARPGRVRCRGRGARYLLRTRSRQRPARHPAGARARQPRRAEPETQRPRRGGRCVPGRPCPRPRLELSLRAARAGPRARPRHGGCGGRVSR